MLQGRKNTARESLASQYRASWTHQGISKLKGEEHQIALLPLLRTGLTDRAYPQGDTGECGVFQEQRRPEPVAKMQFLSWKEIRVALMLSLPTLPHPTPSQPLSPPTPFSQKYILAVWVVGRVERGAGKGMKIYGSRSLRKRKKNLWRTNPKHLCFCPQNDKIILWTENRDFWLYLNVRKKNKHLTYCLLKCWAIRKTQNANYNDQIFFFTNPYFFYLFFLHPKT